MPAALQHQIERTIPYVVQPMPGAHVVKQIVFDGILIVILGVIAAFVYRQPARI